MSITSAPGQGPPGIPAFSFVGAAFVVPAVGQQVTVTVGASPTSLAPSSVGWMMAPQPISFSFSGTNYGVYNVVSTSPGNNTVTIQNNGTTGNPAPSTTVPLGAGIAPAGVAAQPPIGITSANFTIPAIGSTATMALNSTAFLAVGSNLFISGTGGQAYLAITALNVDGLHVTVQNNGQVENSAAGTVINSGAEVVLAGATGPSPIGEVQTAWLDLLADGSTLLWTLSPVLAEKEEATIVALIEFEQIGASNVGGSIARKLQCQCVSGVVTSVISGLTTNMDFDVSSPTPPSNFATAISGCVATIDGVSAAPVIHVTRPSGVPVRARATIGITRMTRPTGLYAFTISPSAGPTSGGTAVTVAGENMAAAGGVTSITLNGVTAPLGAILDYSVAATTGATATAGTGNVVVTRADLTSVTLTNAWTYTSGAVPIISSVSPNFDRAEGGRTSIVITGSGANFTSATVTIGGNAATVTASSSTTVTVTAPAGTAGLANVVVTVGGNASTGGTGAFFYLPSGILSGWDSTLAVASSGSLSTWADFVSGSGFSLIKLASPPIQTNEVGTKQSVVSKNGVGFFVWTSSTAYTGPTMSGLCVCTRPVAPSANARMMTYFNSSSSSADSAQAGAAVLVDNGVASGTQVFRNNVSSTSTFAPAVNTQVFAASLRCDGVTGVVERINGSDLATVAQTGAFSINGFGPGVGFAAGGSGLFAGPPEAEQHVLFMVFANRAWTGADFTVWTAFMNFYYGLTLTV